MILNRDFTRSTEQARITEHKPVLGRRLLYKAGFTLVELLIVVAIIGILISLILTTQMGSIRLAEEKATISLVAKLEQAMTERMDALVNYQADPTPAHYQFAAIYNSGATQRIEGVQRAQVIAQYDYLRAQLPDGFVSSTIPVATAGVYPFNFGGLPFGGTGTTDPNAYRLPLGAIDSTSTNLVPTTGMYGASFEAAAGLYKQLGYHPRGYDGSDNNNDGYIDDALEGLSGLSTADQNAVIARFGKHTHKTARSEMLYAILVEGTGPFGSMFSRDDFTEREVMDTDGDGLMEFVDAWGEPLQFYRWPVLFHSDSQRGFPDSLKIQTDLAASRPIGPYVSAYETREQNPLDPNQSLLAPAWWGNRFNDSHPYGTITTPVSSVARLFSDYFVTLVDPVAVAASNPSYLTYWDRSTANPTSMAEGYYLRRAYYSRFLILSAGPDKIPGTAMLGVNYQNLDDRSAFPTPTGASSGTRDTSGALVSVNVANLVQIENQGGRVDPNRAGVFRTVPLSANRNDTNTLLEQFGQDDITSQMFQGIGGQLQ